MTPGELLRLVAGHAALFSAPRRPRRGPAPAVDGRLPVLLHSQVAWDSVWQRPQELARGLARTRHVVFYAPVQVHEVQRHFRERWRPVRRECGGRLTIVAPLVASGEYKLGPVRALNRVLAQRWLEGRVRRGHFHLLCNAVFDTTLARRFRPRAVAVDLIDDFGAFAWAPPRSRAAERWLLDRAALVTAGTGALRRRYAVRHPSIEYLPSGVDVERFAAPHPEPKDLQGLPRPRLLYVGTLNDRLDGALFPVAARAAAAAGGCVVVVGPQHGSFSMPPGRPPANLHFLGLKPHDVLPGYYQHCDVGIMPFADTPAARAINPVKALEFLATGMPVVSTPIPDVEAEFAPRIAVARPAEWPGALAAAIASPGGPEERAARRALTERRTWDALVAAFEERLAVLDKLPFGGR